MPRWCFVTVLALALPSTNAVAQIAALSYLGLNPCCIAPDGHGANFVVSASGGFLVAKVDSSGNVVSTLPLIIGATDNAAAAAVDRKGNLWIVGSTSYGYTQNMPLLGLIAEVDATGTSLLFAGTLGGLDAKGKTSINAISFDPDGNPYLAGSASQSDFPVTQGAFMTQLVVPEGTGGYVFSGPVEYGFVAKLVSVDKTIPPSYTLAYSTLLGGQKVYAQLQPCPGVCSISSASTIVSALAVDANGVVTVAGTTTALDFPVTPGAFQTECQCQYANNNAFITRLNAQGSGLVWSTLLGTTSLASAGLPMTLSGMTLDSSGNVLVDGITAAENFPVTSGAVQAQLAQPQPSVPPANGFLSKLDSTGSSLLFSTYYGGAVVNHLSPPRLDSQGNIWISGQVSDRTGLVLRPDSLVLGGSLIAELAPDASSVLFSELLPNGVVGQDLALNPNSSLTATGPSQGVAFSPYIANGFVLQLPRQAPGAVSVLGLADSAANAVTQTVAPGEYISIYGTGLGPAQGMGSRIDQNGRIDGSLGGTQVSFGGTLAPLLYAGANQINVLVPYELAGSTQVDLRITTAAGSSQILTLQVVPVQPNIFVVLNSDGTVNSASNPARPGGTIMILVSGAGAIHPALPDGTIAASPAPTPAQAVQAGFSYNCPGPHPQFCSQTVTPTYAAGIPGMVIDMLRVDAQVPIVQEPLFGLSVYVGSTASPPFGVYASAN